MQHEDHVNLLKKAIQKTGGTWADFGSGDGAFTLALSDLVGAKAQIYSIDKDKKRLENQEDKFKHKFPNTDITFILMDFTKELKLPLLDGILMANSLHYVKDQLNFFSFLKTYLKPNGKIIIIEYNIDKSNPWVPYPLSFESFKLLAKKAGFKDTKLCSRVDSSYWNEMYCATTNI